MLCTLASYKLSLVTCTLHLASCLNTSSDHHINIIIIMIEILAKQLPRLSWI